MNCEGRPNMSPATLAHAHPLQARETRQAMMAGMPPHSFHAVPSLSFVIVGVIAVPVVQTSLPSLLLPSLSVLLRHLSVRYRVPPPPEIEKITQYSSPIMQKSRPCTSQNQQRKKNQKKVSRNWLKPAVSNPRELPPHLLKNGTNVSCLTACYYVLLL
ncbi:uncharacterized protein B0I36DRAFT_100575 [Microdochium trichocladiopsis]|uniref:Uncharacterized protein n=1 Tax=Microdochium trichocladiopsis TaxID=1682393 RepID=A0A9P8Y8K8_9PEZI|nr:uncharacterized protein B0I36DRAFT_100575 [Microdochium trichocladiopsis]KAH7032780.1 hypothetical protein B0I36DRAFT_100575 [Microdochium trichocladiopsis]